MIMKRDEALKTNFTGNIPSKNGVSSKNVGKVFDSWKK
jgi:hypothetical protein